MESVEGVLAALAAGEAVVLPFDTVYGLCASAEDEQAIVRLHRLKGRPAAMPVALVAAGVDRLVQLVPELRGRSEEIARALLPGPYTLVFVDPARRYAHLAGANEGTIGVRVPDLAGPARAVLERVGALAATSANRHGGPEPKRLDDVPASIRAGCGATVDGGELLGVASTVIAFTGPEPEVLREGAGPAASALGRLRQ